MNRELLKAKIHEFILNPEKSHFNELAFACFQFQYDNIPLYKKWIDQQVDVKTLHHWEDIPSLPVDTFKYAEISPYKKEDIQFRFYTSGTTEEKKGVHPYKDLDIYKTIIEKTAQDYFHLKKGESYSFRILTPHHEENKDRSLNFMFSHIAQTFSDEAHSKFYFQKGVLLAKELEEDLHEDCKRGRKIILLGTTFSFIHFLDSCAGPIPLPPGSILLDTGGTKGKSRSIEGNPYTDFFSLPLEFQFSEYGMTELTSHFYGNKKQGVFQCPPWVQFHLKDELLHFFDLGNYDFISKILTSDRAQSTPEGGFQLLGRAPKASLRGCSLDYEEISQV